MKITIGSFELSITGKDTITDTKNNDKAVMYFLNELVIVYEDAARFNGCNGYEGKKEDYRNKSDAIYEFLRKKGAYK